MLPATLYAAWSSGAAGRATALLLAAAWLAVEPVSSRALAPAIMGALLAASAAVIWLARARIPASTQIVLTRGCGRGSSCSFLWPLPSPRRLRVLVLRPDQDIPLVTQRLLMAISLVTPAIAIVVGCVGRMHFIRRPVVTSRWPSWDCCSWCQLCHSRSAGGLTAPTRDSNYEDVRGLADASSRDEAEVFWWDGLARGVVPAGPTQLPDAVAGRRRRVLGEVSAELRRRAANTAAFIDPGYWFNEPRSRSRAAVVN